MRTHTFRGRRYRIVTEERVKGYAEVPRRRKGHPEVYIDATLPPKEFLYVAIHEALHAEDPDKHERVVERESRSLARWLWRLGYRRLDE